MGRIFWLLLFGIFLASVFFWVEDNVLDTDYLEDTVEQEVVDKGLVSDMNEVKEGSDYSFYKDDSEVLVWNDMDLVDLRQALDEGKQVLVVLDASDWNKSLYNFDDVRIVVVNDYDGDYFYTQKFGMKLSSGFVIPNGDFRSGFRKAGMSGVVVSL